MEDTLKIGLIVKPQGIKGEVKVQPLTDDIERFRKLKEVIIDETTYRVLKAVIGGGTVFVTLSGVSDRDTAETFRGKFLRVKRENAVPLEEGRYFIEDIKGLEVYDIDTGVKYGKVINVIETGANDVFEISSEDKTLLIPKIDDVVKEINIEKGVILIRPLKGLFE